MYAETLTPTGANRPEFAPFSGLGRYFPNPTGALLYSIGNAIGSAGEFFKEQVGQRIANLFEVGSVRNDKEYIAHQAQISGERGRIEAKAQLGYPLNDKEKFMLNYFSASEKGADTAWGGDDAPADVASTLMSQNNPEAMHNDLLKQYVDNGKTKTEQWIKGLGLSKEKEKAMLDGLTEMRGKWKSGRDGQLDLLQQRETLRMQDKNLDQDFKNRFEEGDNYWRNEAERNYNSANNVTMVDGVLIDLGTGGINKLMALDKMLVQNLVRAASESNMENFTVGSAVRHPTAVNPEVTHRPKKSGDEVVGKSVDIVMGKFFDSERVIYSRDGGMSQRDSFEAFENNFMARRDSIAAWTPFNMQFTGQGQNGAFFDSHYTRPENFPYKTGLDAPEGPGAINIFQKNKEAIVATSDDIYAKYGKTYARDRNITNFITGSAQHHHHGHFMVR